MSDLVIQITIGNETEGVRIQAERAQYLAAPQSAGDDVRAAAVADWIKLQVVTELLRIARQEQPDEIQQAIEAAVSRIS